MRVDRLVHRRASSEDGFAMIAAMMITSIILVLCLAMLGTGVHLELATARDRHWNAAIQVAEAGIDDAIYQYEAKGLCATCGATKTVTGGEVVTTVVSDPRLGYLTLESIGYVPSIAAVSARRLGAVKRKIRVEFGPHSSFKYALFSDSSLVADNGNCPTGDVFANDSLRFTNGSCVKGSIISGGGTVYLKKAQVLLNPSTGKGGNIYTGGTTNDGNGDWSIYLWDATVVGSAHAQQASCPGASPSPYNIKGRLSNIDGTGLAGGSVEVPAGTAVPGRCEIRYGTEELPPYHYDASFYPGIHDVALSTVDVPAYRTPQGQIDLQAYVAAQTGSTNLTGFWRIMGGDDKTAKTISLNQSHVTNDFVLITDAKLDFGNGADYVGPSASNVQIISLNTSRDPSSPAINIENGFSITKDSVTNLYAPVLLYSPGAISLKNTANNNDDVNGAVYAGMITLNNNLNVVYDPRVERTLGFGAVRYERIKWVELPA